MDEKEIQEFDLDDIIKEFADPDEEIREKTAEEILQEATAEVTAPQEPQEEEPQAQAPAGGDTIRFQPVDEPLPESATSDTVRFEPIGDPREEEEPAPQEPEEEKAEPYSDEWEPEYEQPMGEYVPAPPIVFKPKSRLRELKRQLVNGPEKQYYIQLEKGMGKLQVAIFFSLLVVLLSAGAMALYALDWVPESRMRLMVFSQFFAMLVSALLGSYQLLEGAVDLFRRRFSLNTLLLITFVACCVDGVLCLQQLRVPCCAAFSLQVTMSLWSEYQKRNTRLGQLDTMRKATRLDSIADAQDYHEGGKGLLRGLGEVEHFMDTYEDRPQAEKTLSVYAIVALCVSIGAGVLAGVLHGVSAGIQVLSVTLLAAMPASIFVTISRPMAVLERRLHRVGTVLCGWQGVRRLAGKVYFPIDHNDLFPQGTVKINGVKFFGSRQPEQIIAYATAIVSQCGGTLEPIFKHLLESRNGAYYQAESFQRYEDGIGGEVCGEPVLVGTLQFLKTMGVEVPEGIRVSQAVCVAVDGELSGLFAVTYARDRAAVAGLVTLCSYRKLRPVLISGDFMLTPQFIRGIFDVRVKRILFPDEETRQALLEKELPEDSTAAALITGEGLAPFGYAVTGARSLKSAITGGITIHMIGGILGMLMMLALAYLNATWLLTPANLFLYELVWLIPGLLVTERTRNI